MAGKYWIKLFHEILDDPKMGRLPDNLWRRFVECCLLAGDFNQDGRLPPITDIAWRLRLATETLESEFDQLSRYGLLEYRADKVFDDYWFVTNFGKRQSAMLKSEFMRRMRDERQKEHYYGVTEPVTNSNADTDKDKDTDKDADFTAVTKHYSNNIGLMNQRMADVISLAVETYPVTWIIEAIDIAVERNHRSWRYVEGILKNWQVDGFSNKRKQDMSYAEKLEKAGYRD